MSSAEEPRLTWFELEVCPFRFRLAVASGQSMLYGFKSEDGRMHSVHLPYEGNEERAESLLQSLDWLVQANGILEMPQSDSDKAFVSRLMKQNSVHIRIAYSDERVWMSAYPLGAVPGEVQALVEQARYLARREFKHPAEAEPTDAE